MNTSRNIQLLDVVDDPAAVEGKAIIVQAREPLDNLIVEAPSSPVNLELFGLSQWQLPKANGDHRSASRDSQQPAPRSAGKRSDAGFMRRGGFRHGLNIALRLCVGAKQATRRKASLNHLIQNSRTHESHPYFRYSFIARTYSVGNINKE